MEIKINVTRRGLLKALGVLVLLLLVGGAAYVGARMGAPEQDQFSPVQYYDVPVMSGDEIAAACFARCVWKLPFGGMDHCMEMCSAELQARHSGCWGHGCGY